MEKDEFEIVAKRVRGKLLALARDFALPSGIEADDVVQEARASLDCYLRFTRFMQPSFDTLGVPL